MEGPGSFDLISMATRGRTGFARWALGSVAEHVFHGTRLPFLIVRPQKISERQRGMPAQTSAANAHVACDNFRQTAPDKAGCRDSAVIT